MSGPKGGSYRVESAAQREARMLRDAKADYAQAEVAWDNAVARMSAVSAMSAEPVRYARPNPVPADADSAAYARAGQELHAAADAAAALATQARERFAAARHADRMARIIDHLGGPPPPDRGPAARSRWQASQAAQSPVPVHVVDRAHVQQRLRRRLDQLAGLDHDAARVEALLDDIGNSDSQSRIDLILSELDYLITDARTAATRDDEIGAARAALSAMQARLSRVKGRAAEHLRDQITQLINTQARNVPADLPDLVDTAIRDADAEADRLHVVSVMRAALDELGYSAGPEFSTDLSAADATAYARSGSSRYGIKVRLEPGSNRFTAQAVKSDTALTSAQEDVAAERQFCAALDQIVELAKRDGVELDVDIRTAPGACSVQQVAEAKLGAVATAVKRGSAVKEMKRS